jgi:hypothetical protein
MNNLGLAERTWLWIKYYADTYTPFRLERRPTLGGEHYMTRREFYLDPVVETVSALLTGRQLCCGRKKPSHKFGCGKC